MPRKLDVAKILEQNPRLDSKQLCESIELLETLRNGGVFRRRYQLVPPGAGRKAQVADSNLEDVRTIHLKPT